MKKLKTLLTLMVLAVLAAQPIAAEACDGAVAELRSRIHSYVHFANFAPWAPEKYRLALHSLQDWVRSPLPKSCRDTVRGEYAITMFDEITALTPEVSAASRKSEMLGLLRRLNQRGKLVALDAATRDAWMKRTGNPAWRKYIGAYDCHESMLYFDPDQSPFDVGAIIAHELDHLLRDKVEASTPSNASADELVIMDEVRAVIMGGLVQFRFYTDHNRPADDVRLHRVALDPAGQFRYDEEAEKLYPSARETPFELFRGYFSNHYSRFNIPAHSDLHLFSKRGHVYRIWWKNFRRQVSKSGEGIERFGGLNEVYSGFALPETRADRVRLVSLVAKEYFPTRTVDAERIVNLMSEDRHEDFLANALSRQPAPYATPDWERLLSGPSGRCNADVDSPAVPGHEGARPSHEGARPCLHLRREF